MPSRRGSEVPRVFTPPLRELDEHSTLGYDIIWFAENVLGLGLHPWQRWLFIHALEVDGDACSDGWRFRFRTVVVEIGRQNGKTFIGMVLALYALYVLRLGLILGTAQDLEQAEDTWGAVVDMAQADPDLAEEVEHVWRTNGAKRLQLTGNRQYRVKASTRRAGRGKSADVILLDELREHTDWEAWGALTKTTIARENALVWCMSNAGDGASVVLRHLRLQAHRMLGDPDGIVKALGGNDAPMGGDVDDSALGWFEWSAEPGADPSDPEAWAAANPSLGYTIPERNLRSALATDPPDVFRTECLCQWVEAVVQPPFPDGAWEGGYDAASCIPEGAPFSVGVDISADRGSTAVAVCGRRADGRLHGELVQYRQGIGWLLDWLRERVGRPDWPQPIRVAMQGRGAPVSAICELVGAIDGVEAVEVAGRDLGGYCGRLWDAVAASAPEDAADAVPMMHLPQPVLDLAANTAVTRPMGDGAWAWDRVKSREDISPLVALTMAHGLETAAAVPAASNRKPTAYASRGVRTV